MSETSECVLCDWPKEFQGQDLCILHSYDFWNFWEPLANFSIDPPSTQEVQE